MQKGKEHIRQNKSTKKKGFMNKDLKNCELKEYNSLHEKFESGEGYQFEEFLDMIDWMQKPFVTQVEGHEVSLSQGNCAIMMETSVACAITNLLFWGKDMQDKTSQNKQQQTNNTTQNRMWCHRYHCAVLNRTEQ